MQEVSRPHMKNKQRQEGGTRSAKRENSLFRIQTDSARLSSTTTTMTGMAMMWLLALGALVVVPAQSFDESSLRRRRKPIVLIDDIYSQGHPVDLDGSFDDMMRDLQSAESYSMSMSMPMPSTPPPPSPPARPPGPNCLEGTTKEAYLESLDLPAFSKDPATPEGKAFEWLLNDSVNVCTYPTLEQRYALAAFYFSTGGPGWLSSDGWASGEPECTWEFVKCRGGKVTELVPGKFLLQHALCVCVCPSQPHNSRNAHVIGISICYFIVSNNLVGTITEAVAVLTQMETLKLFNNTLSGGLPAVVGNFQDLKIFDLEFNEFSGPAILAEFVPLSNLEQYLVGSNELTGMLPAAIENWTKLTILSVGANMLGGPLPPELGSLDKLGTKTSVCAVPSPMPHAFTPNSHMNVVLLCRITLPSQQCLYRTTSRGTRKLDQPQGATCSIQPA